MLIRWQRASSECLQLLLLLLLLLLVSAGATRPYRDLVLAAQENNAHKVAATILGPRSKPVLYAKHIAKHKVGLNQSLWQGAQHVVSVQSHRYLGTPLRVTAFQHCMHSCVIMHATAACPCFVQHGGMRFCAAHLPFKGSLPATACAIAMRHSKCSSCNVDTTLCCFLVLPWLQRTLATHPHCLVQLLVREPYGVVQSFSQVTYTAVSLTLTHHMMLIHVSASMFCAAAAVGA
jgi:hypothetical protein